jgi:O-acetyl-ADP-ribose deacetylase (regulator of RNase III)
VIKILQGDITRQKADAIVNAANSSLLGGGGVDGAIHRAGGPAILEECKKIKQMQGGCLPGKAVITGGGNLQVKYVIHTVGPVWHGGNTNEETTLGNAYQNSLVLAEQYECETLAFPSISTGAYGFPLQLAAPIALTTISQFLSQAQSLKEVRMVLFDVAALEAFQRTFNEFKL